MSLMLALSAAGFIATSTFGESPGVRMSWSEMWTWNDDTPAIVPAGARISAGKFGRVARSLPKAALTSVNRSPASCMPSPESPANRMTTRSSVSGAGPDGERGDPATGLDRSDLGRSRDRAAQHAEVDGFHRSPFGSEPGGGSAGSRLGGTYRGGRTTTPAALLPFSAIR